MTSSDLWDDATARRYDEASEEMFAPAVLEPTVDFLAALAGRGRALELAIGTGRVALPLRASGVRVAGIELSEPMVAQLRRKVGAGEGEGVSDGERDGIPVVVGDMATARAPGEFALVYLVFNTLGNLRTQTEQVQCFRNAARHLEPGGRFVVEIGVPSLRLLPPGQHAVPFDVSERHTGFDTYDDLVAQQATSHHYSREPDGSIRYGVHHSRFVWPAECDLMAQLAGLELERRVADWHGRPFTAESPSHVSVWRKP